MTLGAGAALAMNPRALLAAQQAVLQRAIPSSGERVPVIGLGSSATVAQVARSEDVQKLKEVMQTAGRIKYIGVTTTFPEQYPLIEQAMRTEPLDFVGLDYPMRPCASG